MKKKEKLRTVASPPSVNLPSEVKIESAEESTGLSQFYALSFIEGGLVMVAELAGAKLLTPYFGASLYSWASTLSITLLALMSGYYFGGYVTTQTSFFSATKIIWALLLSGLLVLLIPTSSIFIMQHTIHFSFFAGLMVSQLFFLFPPIFLMGMISPMIIFQITRQANQSGRSAGNIYAISTFGGILFTLLFGFIIIPQYGISNPVRILGLTVSLLAVILLIKNRSAVPKVIAVLTVFTASGLMFAKGINSSFTDNDRTEVIAKSEGLLGELKITDEQMKAPDGSPFYARKLYINNIAQNYVFRDALQFSLLYYVDFTKHLLNALPPKKSALLVGLGAGSLYAILKNKGIHVETVEIDQRVYDFGVRYFQMQPHDEHTITDGRYFVNTTRKKYDLMILDVIIGENVAGQLLTRESFKKVYDFLNKDGMLIIEHGGLGDIQGNQLIPSVIKTLKSVGFQVRLYNPLMSDKFGDVLFLATKQPLNLINDTFPSDFLMEGRAFKEVELPVSQFENKTATILTDDKNNSDLLLKSHYFKLRENFRNHLAKNQ